MSESLTPRERQVVQLVGRGYCNKEIARDLGITHGTVRMHVHRILRKLGVSNRYVLIKRRTDMRLEELQAVWGRKFTS